MQQLSPAMPVFGDTALLPSQILLQYSCAPRLQTQGLGQRWSHGQSRWLLAHVKMHLLLVLS